MTSAVDTTTTATDALQINGQSAVSSDIDLDSSKYTSKDCVRECAVSYLLSDYSNSQMHPIMQLVNYFKLLWGTMSHVSKIYKDWSWWVITIFYIIFLHLCIDMKYVYATPLNLHWEWLNRDRITVWSSHVNLLILYLVSGTVQFRDHSYDEHNKYIAWFYKRSSGLTIRYITKDCIPNGKYCVASFIPLCPLIGEYYC